MTIASRAGWVVALVAAGSMFVAACSSAPMPATTPLPTTDSATATATATASTLASVSAQQLHDLGRQYLAVAERGNRGLDKDFDALEDEDRDNLAAARADLRDAAAVEHLFDRELLALRLPAPIMATARALVTVNEARAALTTRAAASTALTQLRAYERQLDAANGPVERQVTALRVQLALPPPPSD